MVNWPTIKENFNQFLYLYSLLIGIGLIPCIWGVFKMVFKLLYPDKKLTRDIIICPRSNGLSITKQQNKYYVFMYVDVYNCSPYLKIKIEKMAARTNVDDTRLETLIGLPCIVNTRTKVPIRIDATIDDISYQSFCNVERTKNHVELNLEMVFSANNRPSMPKEIDPIHVLVRTNEQYLLSEKRS